MLIAKAFHFHEFTWIMNLAQNHQKNLHNRAAATHLNYGIFLFNCFKVDVLQQFFFVPFQLHLKINFLKAHEIFVVCIICNFFKNDGSRMYLFLRLQLLNVHLQAFFYMHFPWIVLYFMMKWEGEKVLQ